MKNNSFPWLWIFLIVLVTVGSKCTMEESRIKSEKESQDKAWLNSPEYAFRFCITTAAGDKGTATAEQIEACNKAAGR